MRITDNTSAVLEEAHEIMGVVLRVLALEVTVEAKKIVPVKTGKLRRSIHGRVYGDKARIGSNVHYAPFVEMGTEPHVIVPVNAQALHFFIDGKEIFAKRVQHPGTKPMPYLRPALEIVINRWKSKDKITPGWVVFTVNKAKAHLEQLASEIVTEAKRRAPVQTGRLRESIRAEIDIETGEIAVGSPLYYAPYVEITKPYLTPALETVITKWRRDKR